MRHTGLLDKFVYNLSSSSCCNVPFNGNHVHKGDYDVLHERHVHAFYWRYVIKDSVIKDAVIKHPFNYITKRKRNSMSL